MNIFSFLITMPNGINDVIIFSKNGIVTATPF